MMRPTIVVLIGFIGAGAAINAVAYMQARAMTHFSVNGPRTANPETLGWLEVATVIFTRVNIPRPQDGSTPADLGLLYESHRFPSTHGPILDAWYVPGKTEQPLVLIFHGYAASKSQLLRSARALHDLGFGTLLVDFYGSGGSSGTGTSLGVVEARDVAATMSYARDTWPDRKLVLYGFSMGAAAILRAVAVEKARPNGLIIEASFDNLLNTVTSRFHAMGLPGPPFAQILLFWGGLQWGFNPFSHNPVDYARAVTCPVLILHGARDIRVSDEQARAIKGVMGEKARLVIFPDVPHMPIVEAQPADWAHEVQEFLGHI